MPDFEEQARRVLDVAIDPAYSTADLYPLFDTMSTDDLRVLMENAETIRLHARREWLRRTTKPRGND